jgi:hypothetical protein
VNLDASTCPGTDIHEKVPDNPKQGIAYNTWTTQLELSVWQTRKVQASVNTKSGLWRPADWCHVVWMGPETEKGYAGNTKEFWMKYELQLTSLCLYGFTNFNQ